MGPPLSPVEPFQIGPPGGPYTTIAAPPNYQHILRQEGKGHGSTSTTEMLGATPDFSHVVFGSTDHTLMSKKPTGTDEESYDVYDWFNGELHIIDVKENGELLGKCGATVGGGQFGNGGFPELSHEAIHNAVSEDGSKIFITTPDPQGLGNEPECTNGGYRLYNNPPVLWMHVTETVGGREVSKTRLPRRTRGGTENHPGRRRYVGELEGAAKNGSKAFFLTDECRRPARLRTWCICMNTTPKPPKAHG